MENIEEWSKNKKIILASLFLLISFFIFCFVASNIGLLIAKKHDGELHLFSIFSLFGSNNIKILKAARLGVFAGLAPVVGLTILIGSKIGSQALHGRARWATEAEIKSAGLRSSEGIICGKYGGKFMIFGGTEHVMAYAPTRSGKGIGIVIPNLLNWNGSCVVSDIKKENWNLTAGFRQANGQEVFLFDPLEPEGRTARYNPLGYVRRENLIDMYDDIQRLSNMVFPSDGKDDSFFVDAARGAFVGLVGCMAETEGAPFTFGELYRQISRDGLQDYVREAIEARKGEGRPFSATCVTTLNDFISNSDKTFQSIRSTITSRLNLWLNPRIDAATETNDFDLRLIRKKPMSIYLGVTPDNIVRLAPLLNLFFQQTVDLNLKELPEQDKENIKYKVMFMLDEFPSLGNVMTIVKGIAYIAGYWLRLVTILQSPSQLRAVYGQDESKNYMTNHAIEIVYTPKDQEDANNLSERFGTDTVTGKSRSKGVGLQSKGGGNETLSDQKRSLMLPQELTLTPFETAYVIKGGVRPIKAEKIQYFRDKTFTERLLPKPIVEPIDIKLPPSAFPLFKISSENETQTAQVEDLKETILENMEAPKDEKWAIPDLNFDDVSLDLNDDDAADVTATKLEDWIDSLAKMGSNT